MKLVYRYFLFVLVGIGVATALHAQEFAKKGEAIKNTLIITIDGVNRETFNALLHKQRLPNLQKLINRGSISYLSLTPSTNTPYQAYAELFTGVRQPSVIDENDLDPLPRGTTVFEALLKTRADLTLGLLLSKPAHEDAPPLKYLLKKMKVKRYQSEELPRDTAGTTQIVNEFIEQTPAPFVIVTNFTQPEQIGHTYREGAEIYSNSLIKVDHAIGVILRTLYRNNQWKNTRVWVVSTYPMDKNKRTHDRSRNGFVISSERLAGHRTRLSLAPAWLSSYYVPIPETMQERPIWHP